MEKEEPPGDLDDPLRRAEWNLKQIERHRDEAASRLRGIEQKAVYWNSQVVCWEMAWVYAQTMVDVLKRAKGKK